MLWEGVWGGEAHHGVCRVELVRHGLKHPEDKDYLRPGRAVEHAADGVHVLLCGGLAVDGEDHVADPNLAPLLCGAALYEMHDLSPLRERREVEAHLPIVASHELQMKCREPSHNGSWQCLAGPTRAPRTLGQWKALTLPVFAGGAFRPFGKSGASTHPLPRHGAVTLPPAGFSCGTSPPFGSAGAGSLLPHKVLRSE